MQPPLAEQRNEADGKRQIKWRQKKSAGEQKPLDRIFDHRFLKVSAKRNAHAELGSARTSSLNVGTGASRRPMLSGRRIRRGSRSRLRRSAARARRPRRAFSRVRSRGGKGE